MKTFWNLPKPVREKIYRLALIEEEQPVDFAAYKKTCGYTEENADDMDCDTKKPAKLKCPDLLQVSRKVEREAAPIYFGENTFCLWSPEALGVWKRFTLLRHIKQIRKVALWSWSELKGVPADSAFKAFATLPKLESLTLCIVEEEKLKAMLTTHEQRPAHRTLSWHPSIGLGPQVNMQLLRLPGVGGFRSLRGLRGVKFVKDLNVSSDDPDNLGSMPGGFLETVARKEIMQPRSSQIALWQAQGVFRFLDLPAELRNIIYGMLLIFYGPTYPLTEKPLSFTSRIKYRREADRDALPEPSSALEILRINKQVHDEAHKLFYQNDLVFSNPTEIQDFMCSLSDGRLDSLRSLTLFYDKSAARVGRSGEVADNGLGATLLLLRRLKGVQKLQLLLRFRTINIWSYGGKGHADSVDVSQLKLAKTLFTLRGVADIMIRDLDLLEYEAKCNHFLATQPVRFHPGYIADKARVTRHKASLRHFNHGLQLAQTGVVIRELYTEKAWRDKETWPVLQGSDCGFDKGCSCGESGVKKDVVVETSDGSD